ncbi:MAG: NADH-quinone oxidoreductase subunit L [Candidatus Omnitrophota bacterium]
MNYGAMLLSIIFIPLAGAFILPIAGRVSAALRNLAALLFVLVPLALLLTMLPLASSAKIVIIPGSLAPWFNTAFSADSLAVFMGCVSGLISAVIILYSFSYISHYENQNEYYSMVALFLGAMMGLIFSANLIFMYIFWELTAVTSWRLIGFFREKTHVLKADKSFLVTGFGALAMLIGFIGIYQQCGSFDLAVVKESFKAGNAPGFAVLLILIGIFSKSATLPFHTWLPDAGVAPSPVTALLHAALLVKIGVYAFARLFIATITLSALWYSDVAAVAAISALVCAGAALIETDLKRIIAYSTVSQIGFIFFGLSTGNDIGIIGGLLYILMHGLSKAGLFLCAGIVEQKAKTKNITELGGLIHTMPVTAASFLLCAFSVMGLPPLGGFWSKYMVFAGAVGAKQYSSAFVFLAGAVLTVLYLLRAFNMVFLGEPKAQSQREGSSLMTASVALLALLSLAAGIFIKYPFGFAEVIVRQITGG